MRTLLIPFAALAMTAVAAPAVAQQYNDRGQQNRDYDRRDDRGGDVRNERRDVRNSRAELERERRDLAQAQRYGNRNDIREERRDVKEARKDLNRDRKQFAQAQRRDARDWQRGRNYTWNRPDPRFNGYYADNYYRSGSYYQPRVLGVNERIYRGRDNRYYCRRNDGTTGLIVGGLAGGALGNVIAPGGSKTIGTIIGGGLGAILGQSIGRDNVTCR